MSDFQQILETALHNPQFANVAQRASILIERAGKLPASYGTGDLQSSAEFAKTYAIRRSIGYFDKERVRGLDETIQSLDLNDRPVRLLYAQIGETLISIWVEEHGDTVAGLLVFE
jgi:hypothetical protein